MSISQVNFLLSGLALLGQIFFVVLLLRLIFFSRTPGKFFQWFSDNAIPLAFAVALIATGGSLYYSEIAGLNPCKLCWFQRVFMYPQAILLGLAWWRKDNNVADYALALTALGTAVSLYHNYIYYSAQPSSVCSIAVPCVQQYIIGLGYVTIPMLALTAFLLLGALLLGQKATKRA